jgi:mannitol-1-/sugar-/sorbitol-6-/2-deoxyglucose-6-phosphatase
VTRTVRAVIFDMDGLLIDSEPIWRRTEIEVFGRLGLHLTEEQCLETMGVRVPDVVRLWYSRQPWVGPSVDDVTDEIVNGVIDYVRAHGEPQPGVDVAFETVRAAGVPAAIASSSSLPLIQAVVDRLGLRDDIAALCSGEDEAEGKPHPAVYLAAAGVLEAPPETCVALEDSPNGVLSAKAAGMYCVTVPDPYLANDPRMAEADMTLRSLAEFTPEVLEMIRKEG